MAVQMSATSKLNQDLQAAHRRARLAREGLHVPPIAIFSITNK